MSVRISGGSASGGLTPRQLAALISNAINGAALTSTDGLSEGIQNLYYTDTRVGNYLSSHPAAQGTSGAQGSIGNPGLNLNIVGSVANVSQLPQSANINDAYIDEGDLNLYIWKGSLHWFNAGQIVGSQGVTGSQGTVGSQGIQGSIGVQGSVGLQGRSGNDGAQGRQGTQGIIGTSFRFVLGRPTTNSSSGTQGDVYWDNANNLFYICVSTNTWVRFSATDVFNNGGGGD